MTKALTKLITNINTTNPLPNASTLVEIIGVLDFIKDKFKYPDSEILNEKFEEMNIKTRIKENCDCDTEPNTDKISFPDLKILSMDKIPLPIVKDKIKKLNSKEEAKEKKEYKKKMLVYNDRARIEYSQGRRASGKNKNEVLSIKQLNEYCTIMGIKSADKNKNCINLLKEIDKLEFHTIIEEDDLPDESTSRTPKKVHIFDNDYLNYDD